MNILAIGAHPDDIELGCAGTLKKYVKAGHNVYLCVLSQGGQAGDSLQRKIEQEEAASRLGVKELIWGSCKDTEFSVDQLTISFLQAIINRVKPDEVYTNYFDDTHQDHRALAQCVVSATRHLKRVLYYEDYTSVNYEPDIFVDISQVMEDKINIMNAFQSQVTRIGPQGMDMIEGVKAVARFRGFHGKVQFAEGFKAVRYLKTCDN